MIGTVKVYNRVKSYGFILTDNPDDPDYFVCAPLILEKARFLVPGWVVEFDPVETDKGFVAHNVRVVRRTIAIQTSGPSGVL